MISSFRFLLPCPPSPSPGEITATVFGPVAQEGPLTRHSLAFFSPSPSSRHLALQIAPAFFSPAIFFSASRLTQFDRNGQLFTFFPPPVNFLMFPPPHLFRAFSYSPEYRFPLHTEFNVPLHRSGSLPMLQFGKLFYWVFRCRLILFPFSVSLAPSFETFFFWSRSTSPPVLGGFEIGPIPGSSDQTLFFET